ncbi:hypothetical protein M9Y10_009829 [Tritrichomonas musculus]|uniref:ADP-ribosylation factor n=1 Tax=Tritrichomonas musculus TaxID=1915356 RepID=A0ABR2IRM7_9EUKA
MGSCVSHQAATIPLDEIEISIFGIDNAGKTCFLRSLAGDFNFDSVPTVGFGQETFMYDDVKLKVFDLGGSENFRSVWKRYFAEIWGYVYVVDAADPDRFEESRLQLKEMVENDLLKGKPFIVVANKQDKPNATPAEKLKKLFKKVPNIKKIQFVDASVTTIVNNKCNEGVSTAVSSLINDILKNFEKIGQKRTVDMKEQEERETREREEKLARIKAKRAEEQAAAEARERAEAEAKAQAQAQAEDQVISEPEVQPNENTNEENNQQEKTDEA